MYGFMAWCWLFFLRIALHVIVVSGCEFYHGELQECLSLLSRVFTIKNQRACYSGIL